MKCGVCNRYPEFPFTRPDLRYFPVLCPVLNIHNVFDKYTFRCDWMNVGSEWETLRFAVKQNRSKA